MGRKREAWEDIEREFNKKSEAGPIYRDSRNLRMKYESLKRDIKRKWNSMLANKRNPKGKTPKFTSAEKKIKEIITLPMEGFCDFDSIDDTNDVKSEDNYSSEESLSNSNMDDVDHDTVKKEDDRSDEETDTFAYHNMEESNKNLREDPLVGFHNEKNTRIENNKEMRVPFVDSSYSQSNKNYAEEEKQRTKIQTELLKEELEIKKLQRKILEQELEHKAAIHALEKEHLLLQIRALKSDK